jgi:hypothetical protein
MKQCLLCLSALWVSGAAWAEPVAPLWQVTGLAVTPGGKTVLAAGMDGRVRLVDFASRKTRAEVLAHQRGVCNFGLSADGKRFITGGADRIVRVWDVERVKEIQTWEGHKSVVSAVALSPDGKLAASGDRRGGVHLWDVVTGKPRQTLPGGKNWVLALAFSADGKFLAGADVETDPIPAASDNPLTTRVRLRDLKTLREMPAPESGEGVVFLFGGTAPEKLARGQIRLLPSIPIAKGSASAMVWVLAGGCRGLNLGDATMAVSRCGRYIVTTWNAKCYSTPPGFRNALRGWGQMPLQMWEVSTGTEVWSKKVAECDAVALALAPDGRALVAGCTDGRLLFHDLRPAGWKPPDKWTEADFERAWQALGGEDAGTAYRAVWDLAAKGDESVRWLKKSLKPSTLDAARIKQRLADLDSDTFTVRRTAWKELAQFGEEADELLRAAASKPLPLEMKLSVQRLLAVGQDRPLAATPPRRPGVVGVGANRHAGGPGPVGGGGQGSGGGLSDPAGPARPRATGPEPLSSTSALGRSLPA